MAAASGSSLRFPPNYQSNELDTEFFQKAFSAFLRQQGYAANCPFSDLTLVEQRLVILAAQKLKKAALQ